jgi:hypothetical protein
VTTSVPTIALFVLGVYAPLLSVWLAHLFRR